MDEIQKAARAFERLLNLNTSYKIIAGKKGKLYTVNLFFEKSNFFHLAGLHYLKDLPDVIKSKREDVFDNIINGQITDNYLSKSTEYVKIKDRITSLSNLEGIIDSDKVIFKFYSKFNFRSVIEADYLLCSRVGIKDVYIFLDKDKLSETHFCRSFFPKEKHDYTARQSQLSMLYKEKITLCKREIQLDKLYAYQTISKSEAEFLQKQNVNFEILKENADSCDIRYYKKDRTQIIELLEQFRAEKTKSIPSPNLHQIRKFEIVEQAGGVAAINERRPLAIATSRPPFWQEILKQIKSVFKRLFVVPLKPQSKKITTSRKHSSTVQKQHSKSKSKTSHQEKPFTQIKGKTISEKSCEKPEQVSRTGSIFSPEQITKNAAKISEKHDISRSADKSKGRNNPDR